MSWVCSTVGSSTRSGWKRRSSAASFSMCLRYSARVVAPMHWSLPRARAGLSKFAASMPPSAEPAPMSVWISSMKTIVELSSSSSTLRRRSSNSPRYLVSATRRPSSREKMRLFLSLGGTLPSAMRNARPSASAVLPTPGSPTRQGLFLRRRTRVCIMRSISSSRPYTGSSSPSRACLVRSTPHCASVELEVCILSAPAPTSSGVTRPSARARRRAVTSTSRSSRMSRTAELSSEATRPSSTLVVDTDPLPPPTSMSPAGFAAASEAWSSASVSELNGRGVSLVWSWKRRATRPMSWVSPSPCLLSVSRTLTAVTPAAWSAFAVASFWLAMPMRTWDAVTSDAPMRFASFCASMSERTAVFSRRSNIMRGAARGAALRPTASGLATVINCALPCTASGDLRRAATLRGANTRCWACMKTELARPSTASARASTAPRARHGLRTCIRA
mmetsp:Transcript_6402/g.18531  ORF Transcript_6402/g.18531 Transcript_6402/m.18531 type:complete len:447 (-) Transcript_6402:33-1373(-)